MLFGKFLFTLEVVFLNPSQDFFSTRANEALVEGGVMLSWRQDEAGIYSIANL